MNDGIATGLNEKEQNRVLAFMVNVGETTHGALPVCSTAEEMKAGFVRWMR